MSAPVNTVLPVNISKLQAMSMVDLNQMAKEIGIENLIAKLLERGNREKAADPNGAAVTPHEGRGHPRVG